MVGAVLLEVCGGHRHHVGDRRHRQRVGDETGEQSLDPTREHLYNLYRLYLTFTAKPKPPGQSEVRIVGQRPAQRQK